MTRNFNIKFPALNLAQFSGKSNFENENQALGPPFIFQSAGIVSRKAPEKFPIQKMKLSWGILVFKCNARCTEKCIPDRFGQDSGPKSV